MGKNVLSRSEDLGRTEEGGFWSRVKLNLILGLVEGASVLDVGCGSAQLAKTLLGKGYRVVAIDNDWKAVETAKKKGITAFLSDINDWETDETFDCAILSDVLEHIEDDTLAMRKIRGMLKPKGCVVVNVPSYRFLFGKHDVALKHKRRYSDDDLKAKLEASEFKVEYFRHWNLLAFPIAVFTKISRRDYPPEIVSNVTPLSKLLGKILFLDSRANHVFGISILCKARKQMLTAGFSHKTISNV
ncbi:MAG TPA: class I SAM-dependent methyltransferase [Candidatus Limnocylindrales bacterium]|nr:class I SAM-dependent methyltransferase [Candidatus Limnocylindrales bacterium]